MPPAPLSEYPYQHATAVDHVTVSDAGLHNQQGEINAVLTNALPKWKVDPDDTDHCYADVNAAYAAAHAALGAGEAVAIELAQGKDHTLSGVLTLDPSRDVYIYAITASEAGFDETPPSTRINGTITMQDCSGEPDRRYLGFDNLMVSGTINGHSYTNISLSKCQLDCVFTRTHGVGFPNGGCALNIVHCFNNGTALSVTDTDVVPIFGLLGPVTIRYSQVLLSSGATTLTFLGDVFVDLENVIIHSGDGTSIFASFNSGNGTVRTKNLMFRPDGTATFVSNMGSSSNINTFDFRSSSYAGKAVNFGFNAASTFTGSIQHIGDTAPTNMPPGTNWTDLATNALKIWDGTQWIRTSGAKTYFVDGSASGNGAYATILAAFTAGDAAESAGAEIKIVVADGAYGDSIDFGSNHPVIIKALNYQGVEISGSLTFGSSGAYIRREIVGCYMNSGEINVADGCKLHLSRCNTYNNRFTLNPSAGSIGYEVRLDDCHVSGIYITESGTSSGTREFYFEGGSIYFNTFDDMAINVYKLQVHIEAQGYHPSNWDIRDNPLFDANSDSAGLHISNVACVVTYDSIIAWFANAGSATLSMYQFSIYGQSAGKTAEFGTIGAVDGTCRVISDTAPVDMPTGTTWNDLAKNETKVWDGTQWLRSGGGAKTYFVDGSASGDGAYATIVAAVAAGNAAETAGATVHVLIAPGTYAGNFSTAADRPYIFEAMGPMGSVEIDSTGATVLGTNTALTTRKFIGIKFLGGAGFTTQDGNLVTFERCHVDDDRLFTMTPTAGTVGYTMEFLRCRLDEFRLTETVTKAGTRNLIFDGCQMLMTASSTVPVKVTNMDIHMKNMTDSPLDATYGLYYNSFRSFMDFNNATRKFYLENVAFKYRNLSNGTMLNNASSVTVYAQNVSFVDYDSGQDFRLGTISAIKGYFMVVSNTAPVSCPAGTIWQSTANRTATYVYHATYPYWNWGWDPGHCFVDASNGDATASTGAFASVLQAFNALSAKYTNNEEFVFNCADGGYTDAIDFGTDHWITINSLTHRGAAFGTGALSFGPYASGNPRGVKFNDCEINGCVVTIKDGVFFEMHGGGFVAGLSFDPTGGTVGYTAKFFNVEVSLAPFGGNSPVVETASSGGGTRELIFDGAYMAIATITQVAFDVYDLKTYFNNIGAEGGTWFGFAAALFECNSDAAEFYFNNCTILHYADAVNWFANASSASVQFNNTVIYGGSGVGFNLGSVGTVTGQMVVEADTVPTSPPDGTIWRDTDNHREAAYVYHATYPYWNWDSWLPGQALIDGVVGDAAAAGGAFDTLLQAWNALNANVTAGYALKFVMDDGTYSDNVNFLGVRPIVIESINYRGAIITGDLTFEDSVAKLQRQIRNCELNADTINVEDGCDLQLDNCYLDQIDLSMDPSGGSVGWLIQALNCSWYRVAVDETASSAGTRKLILNNCGVYFRAGSSISAFSLYDTDLHLKNIHSLAGGFGIWTDATAAIFNFNSDNAEMHMDSVALMYYGANALFAGASSINLQMRQVTITQIFSGDSLNFGTVNSPAQVEFVVSADVAPTSPPTGIVWEDRGLNDGYWIWDETYWRNGDTIKQFGLVAVGVAAAEHDVGFDIPTGAIPLSGAMNLQAALTGAGGCTAAAFGTGSAGDPDEICETSALTKNAKGGGVAAGPSGTYDLKISATDGAGVATGTLAGGALDDVRVIVYSRWPIALPNAP